MRAHGIRFYKPKGGSVTTVVFRCIIECVRHKKVNKCDRVFPSVPEHSRNVPGEAPANLQDKKKKYLSCCSFVTMIWKVRNKHITTMTSTYLAQSKPRTTGNLSCCCVTKNAGL